MHVTQTEEPVAEPRKPWSLLEAVGGKCPSCGSKELEQRLDLGKSAGKTTTLKELADTVRSARQAGKTETQTEVLKTMVKWYCANPDCPAQLAARIEHFCSRKCLDIEGIGEEASEAIADNMRHFHEHDGIKPSLFNLFDWIHTAFAGLKWTTESGGTMTFGSLRASKAMAALERAKSLPLHRWLFALGIPTIGENTSKEISRLFKYPGDIQIACQPDGIVARRAADKKNEDSTISKYQISGKLGPDSATKLIEFANSEAGKEAMTFLFKHNIESDNYDPIPAAPSGSLAGKSFVITGTLSVTRDAMKVLIEQAGGKVGNDVNKKTDYLVCGEGGGSKADKAKKLEIPTLTEDALRAML